MADGDDTAGAQAPAEAPSGDGWPAASKEGPQPFVVKPGIVGAGDVGTPITPMGPLAEGETEGVIPPSPLWAMKVCRHFQWSHLLPHGEQAARIRQQFGTGDDALFAIEDGHHHCIIGRHLGATADGCSYALVARIGRDRYDALVAGSLTPAAAFAGGTGRAVYGVVEDGPGSNVMVIGTYGRADEIPADFLPPHPAIAFAEDLPEF